MPGGSGGSAGTATAAPAAAAQAAAALAADTSSSSSDARVQSGAQASTSSAGITYRQYKDESDLPTVMGLIDASLSEPYSVFTYRYFLSQWPNLCWLAFDTSSGSSSTTSSSTSSSSASGKPPPGSSAGAAAGPKPVGVVVSKMDDHRGHLRGYIAMLVVDGTYRGKGLGRALARLAIEEMVRGEAEEVVLEAEVANSGALALYRALGFVRDKHLHRYYLNNQDAYRLKLLLPLTEAQQQRLLEQQAADDSAAMEREMQSTSTQLQQLAVQ